MKVRLLLVTLIIGVVSYVLGLSDASVATSLNDLPTLELVAVESDLIHYRIRNDTAVSFDYRTLWLRSPVAQVEVLDQGQWISAASIRCGHGTMIARLAPGEVIAGNAGIRRAGLAHRVRLSVRPTDRAPLLNRAIEALEAVVPFSIGVGSFGSAAWMSIASEATETSCDSSKQDGVELRFGPDRVQND